MKTNDDMKHEFLKQSAHLTTDTAAEIWKLLDERTRDYNGGGKIDVMAAVSHTLFKVETAIQRVEQLDGPVMASKYCDSWVSAIEQLRAEQFPTSSRSTH